MGFGVFGAFFFVDMVELKYNGKIYKIKQLINTSVKRSIILLSKIAVLKALLLLKLNYLFPTLTNAPDQFMKELNKLLLFMGGARCSSVIRTFAHVVMGRRIDPSWGEPIELFLASASAPRLV